MTLVGNEWREKKWTKIYKKINGEPNVKRGSHKNIPFIYKCALEHTNTQAQEHGQYQWGARTLKELQSRRGLEGTLFVLAPAPKRGSS